MCFRLKILIAKFVTLADKMLSYSVHVHFEIKQQKMVRPNMCIRVEYMRVKIWL